MENGLSIQLFDHIPATPRHKLQWRQCVTTGIFHVSIMNLKIEVMVRQTSPTHGDAIFEGWVKTPMTNWQYLGGGFICIDMIKESALLAVSRQLSALAHHVLSLSNFEQV